MSSLLVFNRVYRQEIQAVMLVFLTQLCELLPLSPFLWFIPPPFPKSKYSIYRQCVAERGWGVLSCVGYHILKEFNTLFLTRFRTNKIA